jgi:hypothetical protein
MLSSKPVLLSASEILLCQQSGAASISGVSITSSGKL